ncbi:unnamed protein product [Eruca vesicaria subsp. sativa]|uniref:N(6)-L-threonylcarbamoyladenine synthase n=1 Tax=Eruca vesicaria subsp. sativa TaxID=29727 RepID=A0ABC8JA61_ERUVS|nr:unnamed protein product [Eruca vesicaria subsp. sativa]
MVRLFLTLSPAISRLSFLAAASPSLRLQRHHFHKLKPKISLIAASNFQRTGSSCSTRTTRVSSSQPKSESSKLDDGLIVLGIETSCDDTAAAVVRGNGEILSQVISSQAELLAQYGGVAPKQAEEAHSRVIDKVVQDALDKANLTEKDLSAVAVTIGPGLGLCLRVGVQKARRVAGAFNLPIVGVHHMEAHALVARLVEHELSFPFMALLISGGHNILVLAHKLGQYTQLGTTVDDAIGEAFDKTAKWLGLDLRRSGGPAVEELALEGDANSVKFNVPMKNHKDCNFSYAGLKTQVRLAIEAREIDGQCPVSSATKEDRRNRADIAASFQVLEKMGCKVSWTENSVTVTGPSRDAFGMRHLRAVDVNMNKMPDVAMTLAVVALFADGPTTIRDVASWRVKETERMIAICTELRKLGATVEEGSDYCVITPPAKVKPAEIDTYDDHRMAMAFSLAACADVPVTIKDPGCTRKTFPDYFQVLESITKH